MAIPDYFDRNAVAISQAISGLDKELLKNILKDECVGISFGETSNSYEGKATTDLLIRLLARLYPKISIRANSNSTVKRATRLAKEINPRLKIGDAPTIEISVGGDCVSGPATQSVYVGSDGWTARLSSRTPQGCGDSDNPFGAGLAACLGAKAVFRHLFIESIREDECMSLQLPAFCRLNSKSVSGSIGHVVLMGAGAIGNAAAWALSRANVSGSIDIVDDELIDLGNLQRYVMACRWAEGETKASLLASYYRRNLKAKGYKVSLAQYFEINGHNTKLLLLALDSAEDRRAGQASLPRFVANAWTAPDDSGVSVHNFETGGCVSCLYHPSGPEPNEDELIAHTLGIPDRVLEVRHLLVTGQGVTRDLLADISQTRCIAIDKLLTFEGRSLRSLYVEGFCGGAVIPLSEAPSPSGEVHVPLAYQSAISGILLAAAAVNISQQEPKCSEMAQIRALRPQRQFQVVPLAKHPSGNCICQDKDYVEVFRLKYMQGERGGY